MILYILRNKYYLNKINISLNWQKKNTFGVSLKPNI